MGRGRKRRASFVALGRDMLKSPEWRVGLTAPERDLYIQLKYKYVGTNNGEIVLHYSEMKDMMAPATIAKAYKGLIAKEWVEKTRTGGMYRCSCKYKLTGKYDKTFLNYGM